MFREELVGALSQLRALQIEVWTAPGIGPVDLQDASRLTERAVLLARGELEIPFELMIPIIREEIVPPTAMQRAALALGPIMGLINCCSGNKTAPEQDRSPRGLQLRIPMLGPNGNPRSGAAMRRTRCEVGLDLELVGMMCPDSVTQADQSPEMDQRKESAIALARVSNSLVTRLQPHSSGKAPLHKHRMDAADMAADDIVDRLF